MKSVMSYEQALNQRNELNKFINIVDSYPVKDLKSWVIKEYVISYSIPKVIRSFMNNNKEFINKELDREKVISILNAPPSDDLHKIAKRMYRKKDHLP